MDAVNEFDVISRKITESEQELERLKLLYGIDSMEFKFLATSVEKMRYQLREQLSDLK